MNKELQLLAEEARRRIRYHSGHMSPDPNVLDILDLYEMIARLAEALTAPDHSPAATGERNA